MVWSVLRKSLVLLSVAMFVLIGEGRQAQAFGPPQFIGSTVTTPNGGSIFFTNLQGTSTAFVSLGGSGEVPGGAIYSGGSIFPLPAVSPAGLTALGWVDVTILSQNGADATYATDGYMGVVFTARETPGGQLYRYEIALSGVTTTQIINTRTAVDTTRPTVTISPLSAISGGQYQATITLSEPSTNFVVGDLSATNATAAMTGSGANYVATLTPQSNRPIELFVPANVFTDAAGNPNLASNRVSSVQPVVNTQRLIQAFQNARANSLVSNQPKLTPFLSEPAGGALDAAATQGAGYLNFASSRAYPIWFNLTGNWSSQDDFDSSYALAVMGAHRQINPNLLIGGMVQIDYAKTKDGVGDVDGTGWLIGPYVVAKMPGQPVFIEGRALYGQASNEISPFGTYTDKFDSDRWLVQTRVTGQMRYGDLTLMPLLDVSYASDDQKAYTDGLGNRIPDQDFSLTTARLGLDFSRPLAVSRGEMTLTGGLSGVWSSTSGTGTAVGVAPIGDTTRGRADLGLDYRLENSSTLSAGIYYDGIGESGFESYAVNVMWRMAF